MGCSYMWITCSSIFSTTFASFVYLLILKKKIRDKKFPTLGNKWLHKKRFNVDYFYQNVKLYCCFNILEHTFNILCEICEGCNTYHKIAKMLS